MLDHTSWAHTYIDLDTPNAARIYDYLLDGATNSEADREMARQEAARADGIEGDVLLAPASVRSRSLLSSSLAIVGAVGLGVFFVAIANPGAILVFGAAASWLLAVVPTWRAARYA